MLINKIDVTMDVENFQYYAIDKNLFGILIKKMFLIKISLEF
jgi:hypothetical protein